MFELLNENGLGSFYDLADAAGARVRPTCVDQFKFLDEPTVRQRFVDYQDEAVTRVTFLVPAIHCAACVWLLENLFRLKPGVGESQVNFPRKEVTIVFETATIALSEVVALLASLGYEPELKLSDIGATRRRAVPRQLWIQLGLAGFAFGNLMLLAIGVYLGVDAFSGPAFRRLAGGIGLLLSVPVVIYSAMPYWRTAWASLRQKRLAIEVPIAAGIVAIFTQSAWEVLSGRGEGYFDSLCGLIFFLLCGRLFQQKTFDRLSFERDYESFFPLSATRRVGLEQPDGSRREEEEQVAISQLRIGDVLVVRNGELIPADSRVVSGAPYIDYSFVTGESQPVAREIGDYVYAGGRQVGGAIEARVMKEVSQSYLTSLWNQEAFRKERSGFETLINAYSQRFTAVVIAIACGAALFWAFANPGLSVKAFTSVLIVACPCALALAAPFTLGTAIRALGRREIFVKGPDVIEAMAKVQAVVFDKTGTLTVAGARSVAFEGAPLNDDEQRWIQSLAQQSTHPLSRRVADSLVAAFTEPVRSCEEHAGCGVAGVVGNHELLLGSRAWLESRGARFEADPSTRSRDGSTVHVAIDGVWRGCFTLENALRPEMEDSLNRLSRHYELTLLSGDNSRQRGLFAPLFGGRVRFGQSPLDKLRFIESLQRGGQSVLMVGDGLNDAGALKQSNVGVAVVENISAFSPASDVIMSAAALPSLDAALRLAKRAVRVVRAGVLLSSLYNVVGISIAAAGLLSPVVCAILMPISSISVVAFSCGATAWAAGRSFGDKTKPVACAATDGEPGAGS